MPVPTSTPEQGCRVNPTVLRIVFFAWRADIRTHVRLVENVIEVAVLSYYVSF